MLRYCGWCGKYLGANSAKGYQIAVDLCAIDTTGICRACQKRMLNLIPDSLDGDKPFSSWSDPTDFS